MLSPNPQKDAPPTKIVTRTDSSIDMADFSTPLTALRATAKTQPYATAIKQAHNATTGFRYSDVSYRQFEIDIESTASYWKKTFLPHDIAEQSVIGVCEHRMKICYIFGVYLELAAGAAALVHDPFLASVLQDSTISTFSANGLLSKSASKLTPVGPLPKMLDGDQILMIYHTSGSTSGVPKLVPITARWMDCLIKKISTLSDFLRLPRTMVKVAIGSSTHTGSTMLLLESVLQGGCFIFQQVSHFLWGQGGRTEAGFTVVELVVPPESPDFPHYSLRDATDGKFHTGDLFLEIALGEYAFKGRDDDWIKMEMALRCDANSIEVDSLQCCGDDLIHAVVAIGVGRPSPATVIEPKHYDVLESTEKTRELQLKVLQRITPFHRRRYKHERIEDVNLIFVVPQRPLPRTDTKGNIRRLKVEEQFKQKLDEMFK
ncbi:hypothetical protein DER46DRAFT_687723 [Fusarium sp. MPI-SDFR-AT-0072]|nr:hypothetical protein DER46DRAFT_687723 [Fusarium sp. MPI-SDFR-AT-0072]